ncbi:hypothetical protein WAK64_15435 [Bacillus spongiae]|uniref:Uncharacterized protein n=1 Tax=Bacillus spongiae TaxID=2683610 RepID=A0ABU8HH11_9BACI
MVNHQEYIAEREKIDFLIEKEFTIIDVTEDLNGSIVVFSKGEEEISLHVKTAEARKYFSNLLVQKNEN